MKSRSNPRTRILRDDSALVGLFVRDFCRDRSSVRAARLPPQNASLRRNAPTRSRISRSCISRTAQLVMATQGKNGAAISLANPVYLAVAGTDIIQKVTANGVPGTLMPAFAKSQGGMLTDQQITILAQGVESAWGRPAALQGQSAPPYASSSPGDPTQGQQAFTTFCASCHGSEGTGLKRKENSTGSLVDPAYLALISDQGLRSHHHCWPA